MLWTITTPSTVCVVLKTTENRWIILEISLCMSPKCCDVSPPEAKSRLTVTDQIWTVILWKSRDTSNFLLLYLVDQIILEARSTLEVSPSNLWNLTIFSYALDWEKFRGPRESERPAGRDVIVFGVITSTWCEIVRCSITVACYIIIIPWVQSWAIRAGLLHSSFSFQSRVTRYSDLC